VSNPLLMAVAGHRSHRLSVAASGVGHGALITNFLCLNEVSMDKAEKQTPGSRAVSVEPKSKANHPVAVVTLVKGAQFKSVSEPLE